tara:strand:+ start:2098 stop:2673 length:576 start_codon:yes stop_codon:yes gene_type:complete
MRQQSCIFLVVVVGLFVINAVPRAATDITVPSLDGDLVSPLGSTGDITVLMFVTTDCPIANRYAPEIRRIYDEFGEEVTFWLVYISDNGQGDELNAHHNSFGFPMQGVRDTHKALVDETGVAVTPEVAVYDATQVLRYRGRINDRYVEFGVTRPTASTHDLRDVLSRLVAGEHVPYSETQAVGCYIPGVGD